ncbi:MAG: glycosyltransferase [Proteobacteria bacterium]|nr:glycosyltransferase [Pseudomonadota bacterium]
MPAQPLRVLHLIGAPKAGGAETFAVRLITALARQRGVEVRVLARQGSWAAKQLRAGGVKVVVAPFGGVVDRVLGVFGYGTVAVATRVAGEFKPQVVQGWMNRGTAFVPRGPWVRVGRMGGFYKLKYYLNKVDYIIGNTKEIVRHCLDGGWPQGRVELLPNFVPVPPRGWEKQRAGMRKKLRLPERALVLLAAGRLHRVKGLDSALAALALLPAHCHLVLLGEGPLREDLQEQVRELGLQKRVHFTGWVSPVAPYAAAADVWLVPSRFEPLGNTVLDGWAHARPVVATRTQGPAGLIKNNQSGLLVPVDDAAALAAAVARLQKSPALRRRLVAGGLVELRQKFSQPVVVGRYVAYYRRLVKQMEKGAAA